MEYEGRVLEVRLKVREAPNGKFFYDFFNESEPPGRRQQNTPPDTRGSSVPESANSGGNLRQAHEGHSAHRGERPQERGDNAGSGESIPASPEAVNLDVRDVTPDWTPEPPPRETPPRTPEDRALVDRALDAEATRLVNEGRATPEERALLEQHKAELEALARDTAFRNNSGYTRNDAIAGNIERMLELISGLGD